MSQKINRRITYQYLDNDKGILENYFDIDLNHGEEMTDTQIRKIVQRKWDRLKYYKGFIDTVEFVSIQ